MFTHKTLKSLAGCVTACVVIVMFAGTAGAISGTVQINAVQATGPLSAKDELIELKNISDQAVDVTGWKIEYLSSGGISKVLYAFVPIEPASRLMITKNQSETFVSREESSLKGPTEQFMSGMNHIGGTVRLVDANGATIDTVGWGNASVHEGSAAAGMDKGHFLMRTGGDSDNNAVDFELTAVAREFAYGNLVEVELADACSNIEGVQEKEPAGYYSDAAGVCHKFFVPVGLRINELLPNPSGTDNGHEFVEIYNPSDETVELDWYWLTMIEKKHTFPDGAKLLPRSYATFSDTQLGMTLINSIGSEVRMMAYGATPDDAAVELSKSPAYADAADDEAWAWFADGWAYTNQSTRDAENKPYFVEQNPQSAVLSSATELAACDPGKFRNPLTNRCKTIEPKNNQLMPCDPGQYRNPETNRCKQTATANESLKACKPGEYRNPATNRCKSLATATSTLKPCGPGEFRNPATNRCKSLAASASSLKPCQPGYERNPESNRCRKVLGSATNVLAKAFPVEPIPDTRQAFVAWWAFGGVLIFGLVYAGWEWRHEIGQNVRRVASRGTKP